MSGNPTRRNFLGLNGRVPQAAGTVRPPYSDDDVIAARCDGCGDCIAACGEALISLDADGFPKLGFDEAGCTLCGDCADACPADALGTLAASASHPFPNAYDVTSRCLSLRGISCRLCEDACEPRAIRFRLMTEGRALPIVDLDLCSGCGTCVSYCPEKAFEPVPRPAPFPAARAETRSGAMT